MFLPCSFTKIQSAGKTQQRYTLLLGQLVIQKSPSGSYRLVAESTWSAVSSMASSNFGSLFGGGGLGATTPQPQQQQQQQQPASIFSPNNQSSIFGNTSAAQTAPNTSVFGSQSQTQPQPNQTSILGQSQARASGQTTQPAFFNSLLERGKKRPLSAVGQNGSFEELPSLQLGLGDIRRKARELGSGGPKDSQHGLNTKA